MDYEHVFFRPWVGRDYHPSGGLFGLRVMVLGESHYVWESTPPPRDETERITERVASCREEKRFATNVELAVVGAKQLGEQRRRFWDGILFYNYIQVAVSGPRVRPTYEMWQGAKPAFLEVLRLHVPHLILVLGEALWSCIPEDGHAGPPISLGSEERSTWLYPTAARGEGLALNIPHPSSWGFSGRRWHPWVQLGLTQARVTTGAVE